jgi:hypothetical protein
VARVRAWPLHIVFATLLVGSLAARERAADVLVEADISDLKSAVTRVARSHDLVFQHDLIVAGNVLALTFDAPDCSRPVLVVLRISFDFEPVLQSAREQGYLVRYVYIDRSWERPNRLAFFFERMKYSALATFGLSRYVPSGHLLAVGSQPQCPTVKTIDWRNVWNRDYIKAAERP